MWEVVEGSLEHCGFMDENKAAGAGKLRPIIMEISLLLQPWGEVILITPIMKGKVSHHKMDFPWVLGQT